MRSLSVRPSRMPTNPVVKIKNVGDGDFDLDDLDESLPDAVTAAIPLSEYRKWGGHKEFKRPLYSKIFQRYTGSPNKYRIYLPLTNHPQTNVPVVVPPSISAYLKGKGYLVDDYKTGMAVDEKTGKRRIKIGKLLTDNPKLKAKFDNDPQRSSSKKAELLVVISRHPYDLAGMSYDRGWRSCMHLTDGENNHYLVKDIKSGTLIAYLVDAKDKNINKPLARNRIYKFIKEPATSQASILFVREPRIYGTAPDSFKSTLQAWLDIANSSLGASLEGMYCIDADVYKDNIRGYVDIYDDVDKFFRHAKDNRVDFPELRRVQFGPNINPMLFVNLFIKTTKKISPLEDKLPHFTKADCASWLLLNDQISSKIDAELARKIVKKSDFAPSVVEEYLVKYKPLTLKELYFFLKAAGEDDVYFGPPLVRNLIKATNFTSEKDIYSTVEKFTYITGIVEGFLRSPETPPNVVRKLLTENYTNKALWIYWRGVDWSNFLSNTTALLQEDFEPFIELAFKDDVSSENITTVVGALDNIKCRKSAVTDILEKAAPKVLQQFFRRESFDARVSEDDILKLIQTRVPSIIKTLKEGTALEQFVLSMIGLSGYTIKVAKFFIETCFDLLLEHDESAALELAERSAKSNVLLSEADVIYSLFLKIAQRVDKTRLANIIGYWPLDIRPALSKKLFYYAVDTNNEDIKKVVLSKSFRCLSATEIREAYGSSVDSLTLKTELVRQVNTPEDVFIKAANSGSAHLEEIAIRNAIRFNKADQIIDLALNHKISRIREVAYHYAFIRELPMSVEQTAKGLQDDDLDIREEVARLSPSITLNHFKLIAEGDLDVIFSFLRNKNLTDRDLIYIRDKELKGNPKEENIRSFINQRLERI